MHRAHTAICHMPEHSKVDGEISFAKNYRGIASTRGKRQQICEHAQGMILGSMSQSGMKS